MIGPEDWPHWRGIRLAALAGDPDAFGSTLAREQAYDEQRWRGFCHEPATLVLDGDEPVAMGSGFADEPGRLMVVAMWTRPERRGEGLGGRVLDAVTAWAVDQGLRPHLFAMLTNPDAERLYTRHGYVRTGLVEEHGGRLAAQLELPG
ncbi:GNAT family N-acetyltransferase [Nocardioides mangrovicus]|uniref:GNAT family N-acetyltransferase n=2 Tax=Nocardioides mangrovicus TaxID=2478913 RepID=A0A3L8P4Q5_9ACTN|nr:GNAT family N-acetyltransferase [Nocardioides mangrovicus]